MPTLYAEILRSESRQTRPFGPYADAVNKIIAKADPAYGYERRNKDAAEAAWHSIESLIETRFRGTAREIAAALEAAGKMTVPAYRAACAVVARQFAEPEYIDILLAPFDTLWSAAVAA